VKGTLYALIPSLTIVDISHSVRPHDVLQSAYILKNAARNFPESTVHLISIDTSLDLHGQYIIARAHGHYYIGADNGIFSLLFAPGEAEYFRISDSLLLADDIFPDKNVFAPIAAKLLSGTPISNLAVPTSLQNIKQGIEPVEEGDMIRGSIVFVDGYDNAITNISRQMFERKLEGRTSFAIFYRRKEKITTISNHYHDVKGGKELALFNEPGYLEIAMNSGQARSLLGLQVGGPVIIEFYD
jgi:S-adenosylmethionine hydrolase